MDKYNVIVSTKALYDFKRIIRYIKDSLLEPRIAEKYAKLITTRINSLEYYPYKYEEYSDEQRKRFTVRPGITGLSQVKVRNSTTWDERIKIDVEYISNIKFIEDLKIILNTISAVISKDNIY